MTFKYEQWKSPEFYNDDRGPYLLKLTFDLGFDDAEAFELAAKIIRHMEVEPGGVTYNVLDLLETADILSESHPVASWYIKALAYWFRTDDRKDFHPPTDADAIAAAEQRAADERQAAIVEFLYRFGAAQTASLIEREFTASLLKQQAGGDSE